MRMDLAEFVHGDPLPVSDMEVGPDGMLYFTTGGNGAEGGLFRVRYVGTTPVVKPDLSGIHAVTRQAQPLSSWGYAAIEGARASMGARFATELERVARRPERADRRSIPRAARTAAARRAASVCDLLRAARRPIRTIRCARPRVSGRHARRATRAKAITAAALKDTQSAS